ncbi:hypothetical protein, partial [Mycolicibacillus trivialis]|uniref:hypothetical protein n=1 Tax=Mycolicibacillus trivialis TaxID=1798 RepID=UPI0021F38B68
MAKNNNKQKPPNTLLSSQTTHPLTNSPIKLDQKTPHPQPRDGQRHGKKQQQTKTTKHTIEFSNNTP